MGVVLIKNKNLYKLYKDLPYTFNTAIFHLIDCFIKQSMENKTEITLYFNLNEKWLQLICNNNLYPISQKEKIWQQEFDVGTFNWKYPTFFIGQAASIELKNAELGMTNYVDLNTNGDEIIIDDVNGQTILTNYQVGTQLSITNFNYDINQTMIIDLINQLKIVYQAKIANNLLDLQLIIIKDNEPYQIINQHMQVIKHTKDIQPIKPPNFLLSNIIKSELFYNNKAYQIECEIINANEPFIYCSNKNRIITDMSNYFISQQIRNEFNVVGINIKILNLKLNLFRTDFIWQLLPINTLLAHVYQLLTPYLIKTKTNAYQTSLMTEQFDKTQLADLKSLLTKSLDGSINNNHFDDFEIKKDNLKFTYHADDNKKIIINLIKTKRLDFQHDWLQLESVKEEPIEQNYEYNVTLNIDHPFFKDFVTNQDYANKIEQFVVCYAIAETICRLDDSKATQLKYEINKLLRGS